MSEILKNYENSNDLLNLKEWLWEKSESYNILKIEDLLNPNSKEKQDYISKETEKCCHNLNNIFSKEFEKKWLDFISALNSKIEKPIWV